MRCLYCGKELALLKRLTGGGEFCSEAHKQSYQEEYNRLALSRLLQAQAKGGEAKATQHASEGPRPAAPVAVAEAVVEEPEVEQVDELEPVEQEEQEEQEEAVPEQAGFFLDKPDFVAIDAEPPYQESWSDSITAAPAIPEWQFQNALSTLSLAALVPLEIHPEAWQPDQRGPENKVRPKEFTSTKVELNVPLTVTLNHEFPTAGPIPLNISSKTGNSPATVIRTALNFREQVLSLQSALLEPLSTGIEFPSEEDSVSIPGEWFNEGAAIVEHGASESDATPAWTSPEPESEPEPEAEPTPRSALQALTRLHQDLLQDEVSEPAPVMARSSSATVRVSVVHSLPEELAPAPEPEPVAVAVAPVVDIIPVEEKAPEPVREESKPPVVLEFVEIPLNAFPPAKANQVSELDAVQQASPLLPRLKGLPLRPKVALAPPGFGAPAKAATPKTAPPAPAPEPKAKVAAAAPVETEKRRPSISEKIAPSVPRKPATAPASAPAEKPVSAAPSVPKPAKPIVREPVRKPAAAAAAATPPPEPPAPKPPQRTFEEQPALTFEALEFQLMSTPTPTFWSSLKAKLIIAIVLVMGGVAAYMYLGSKSKPPVGDGSGPSIMVGEGGWVQNWAGDPSGMHVGREITFYRPSLKLSDYRIEFQAQIETKSVGWVFRASDPNNYYAMKIAILGTGLPMKVALFKYIVHNGHETEVGRVGIDTPIAPDSAINVRVDVRGAKFNTTVQGTPVDVWTDDQLKTGGVGFLNERGERARVKTVSISYLTGGTK